MKCRSRKQIEKIVQLLGTVTHDPGDDIATQDFSSRATSYRACSINKTVNISGDSYEEEEASDVSYLICLYSKAKCVKGATSTL